MRMRYIIKQMAEKRMQICEKSPHPDRCRRWIRQEERRALIRVALICPYLVCKHLGFCGVTTKGRVASLSLDQQLEAHLAKEICGEFGEMQTICHHIAASNESHRYAGIYMAVLHNDSKWINDDLRVQVQSAQSAATTDLCSGCKNIVQAWKDLDLQVLVSTEGWAQLPVNFFNFRKRFALLLLTLVNSVRRKTLAHSSSTTGSIQSKPTYNRSKRISSVRQSTSARLRRQTL